MFNIPVFVKYFINVFFLILPFVLILPSCIFRFLKKLLAKETNKQLHYNPFKNTHEDVFKSEFEIISQHGFSIKEYKCTTKDDVQLTLWRLQIKQQNQEDKKAQQKIMKKSVLIQHGLLDCSMSWFVLKQNCLPFMLVKLGYDVWVSNNRGTKYTSKDVSTDQYWNYNLDHIIEYDVPCLINFVLQSTGFLKLIYIGHSQGTTQFLSSLDIHPDIAPKIQLFIGLGPVISLKNIKFHLPLILMDKLKIYQIMKVFGFNALFTFPVWMNKIVGLLMFNSWIFHRVCHVLVQSICGKNKNQSKVCPQRFGFILSHEPGGCSVMNGMHWVQVYRNGTMKKFDYGKKTNLQTYGSQTPPSYSYNSLKYVDFQSHLFKGSSDHIISDQDFQLITSKLHPQKHKVHTIEDYAHLDYLWSENAMEDIYKKIKTILDQKYITDTNKQWLAGSKSSDQESNTKANI